MNRLDQQNASVKSILVHFVLPKCLGVAVTALYVRQRKRSTEVLNAMISGVESFSVKSFTYQTIVNSREASPLSQEVSTVTTGACDPLSLGTSFRAFTHIGIVCGYNVIDPFVILLSAKWHGGSVLFFVRIEDCLVVNFRPDTHSLRDSHKDRCDSCPVSRPPL
jgi:hypothetical protein